MACERFSASSCHFEDPAIFWRELPFEVSMIGSTISHYKILEKLGEGGMGVVYKALDTKLNRTVALKFLPDRVQKDPDAKARFLQEAQAAAALNHPNICTIYGVDEQDGQLYMAMEFVDGGTLRDSSGLVTGKVQDAVKMAVQIGDALQEAHAKGIVHRDIKADNIMLSAKGQAKVMDFGLAKLKGALKLTRTSSTVGTLGYMAPEQIQGGSVDPRSDIFSFGVLLFEMLTGRLPFRGEHEAAMMYSILNEAPESVQNYIPDASPDLSHILARALEKDPEDRYQSMADMVSELRRLLKQSSKVSRASIPVMAAAPPPSSGTVPIQQTSAPSAPRNNTLLIGAGIAVVALVIAGLVYVTTFGPSIELNPDMTVKVLDVPIADVDYPGLSGDGNWITFTTRPRDGVGRVYLMNTGGGEPRAVVADSGVSYEMADLSFDASRIVYTAFPIRGNGIPSIYITSALGSGTRLLADTAVLSRWQPNGERVFFFKPVDATPTGKVNLASISADGTDLKIEVEDAWGTGMGNIGRISLSVSYDGRYIAWLHTFLPERYQEIIVGDRETGEQTQMTHDKKNIDEVCWTSDDNIIFSSNRSGNTNLWIVPASGGDPVQITKGSGPDLGIRISKDRRKLLYYVNENVGNLWAGSLATGVARQITNDDKVRYTTSFSPEGDRIAYGQTGGDELRQTQAIYVSNVNGSGRVELTSPTLDLVHSPVWSPDAKRIAYSFRERRDSTQTNITYVVDIARPGASKRIGAGTPIMWLDNDRVITVSLQGTLILSISNETVERVFRDSTAGFPVRGGTHFFYRDHHVGYEGRWIVRIDERFNPIGEPRKLMGLPQFATSRDREYVVYLDDQGLWKVMLPSGVKQRIRNTFAGLTVQTSFTLNPKTQEIVYGVNRQRAKLVMLENPFR